MNSRVRKAAGRRALPAPALALFVAPVLLLGAAPPAAAEDLLQVYGLAQAHDAALRSAQALRRSAAPRAAQAEALLRPSVHATGSSTRSSTDPSPTEVEPQGARVDATTSSVNLNFRQPLFNRAASADIARARTGLEIAGAEFQSTQQEFIVRVAQAYFDVLSAQDVLAATQAGKASVAGQLDAARRNYAAGTAIVTDVRDAQARHDRVLAQEISAANDLRVRRLALERLAGRSPLSPQPLALPAALPPLQPAGVDAWLDAAAEHPSVQRVKLLLQGARQDTERARAAHLPTLDAVGSVGLSRASGTSVGIDVAGRSRNASVGVELNLPLFAGHATQNRIAETLLLEEKAREDLEATRRSVAEATEQAYFSLVTGLAQVQALEAAELSSKLSLEGTQLGYRAGARVNLDVLNAQTQLLETQRDLARARYDALMGGLKLRAAAGRLEPGDLAAVNALLAR
jgi:outer membrane protein